MCRKVLRRHTLPKQLHCVTWILLEAVRFPLCVPIVRPMRVYAPKGERTHSARSVEGRGDGEERELELMDLLECPTVDATQK